jgi:hypothetical protein
MPDSSTDPQSAAATPELPPDTLGPEDDEEALAQLQELLVGDERQTVARMEEALVGFIRGVVRNRSLDDLLQRITAEAVRERLREVEDEIPRRVADRVDEALERELSVRRGRLPDAVAPLVDDAVSEHISLTERHLPSFLQPAFRETVDGLVAEGKRQITDELTPEVLQIVRKRVEANRDQLDTVVGDLVDRMVGGAVRTSAERHLLSLVAQTRRETTRRNRRILVLSLAGAGVLLLLSMFLLVRQQSQINRLARNVAAGAAAPQTRDAAPNR